MVESDAFTTTLPFAMFTRTALSGETEKSWNENHGNSPTPGAPATVPAGARIWEPDSPDEKRSSSSGAQESSGI
jgi:hypothetical protein